MLGTRISIITFVAVLSASSQDYFPLSPGDQWVYRGTGTRSDSPLVVQVTGTAVRGGVEYSVVRGLLAGDVMLRKDVFGNVFAREPATGGELRWWWFQAPENQPYDSVVSCCGGAMVTARSDSWLEMRYPGVFQVGVDRDVFVANVGLVSRTIATGGPTYGGYELIYARIGEVNVISSSEVSFAVAADGKRARLTLRVLQPEPLALDFNSGQVFDLVVRDAAGTVVYRWSDGHGFTLALQTLRFSGEKNWPVELPALAPGEYAVEGYLTSNPRMYSATSAFTVK